MVKLYLEAAQGQSLQAGGSGEGHVALTVLKHVVEGHLQQRDRHALALQKQRHTQKEKERQQITC